MGKGGTARDESLAGYQLQGEEVVSENGKHRGSNPKLDGTNDNMHAHTSRKELLFDLPCIRAVMLTNKELIS